MPDTTFPTDFQHYIHLSRYARWNEGDQRREVWPETVDRYFDFFHGHLAENHGVHSIDLDEDVALYDSVLNLESMPSMRCLMTAGRALARDHTAGYNCAYRTIEDPRAFDEILFLLMCGTGVGFSVERQYVNRLPEVPDVLERSESVIVVRDSKRGWSEGLRELIAALYAGRVPHWDLSRVRKAGSRLKTMGGRASGPEPLDNLLHSVVRVFEGAVGRRLTSIECHDLACLIADCVVVGGVRRSALLSLSNLSDQRMRDAKAGQWWNEHQPRAMANNSIAFTERPDVGQFMQEWTALHMSRSGERGFFNREAATLQAGSSGRRKVFWDEAHERPIDFGTNPCSEILLRPKGLCNLSEVIARPADTEESLARKVRAATTFGTWQSTLTKFRYLTKGWQNNAEEERLLGVSITGIMDCPLLNGSEGRGVTGDLLEHLKEIVLSTNREWADRLAIPHSVATTCVKPSGTVSSLTDAAAGIHPRYAPTYIRRTRQDRKDPLTDFMIAAGFPHEQDVTRPDHVIFQFPMRSPQSAICSEDVTAIQHLELWKVYQDHWCEHKPSITVTLQDDDWPRVGGWVWDHFDQMTGVSFLPAAGSHTYVQAPYEAVGEERFLEMEEAMPRDIDWSRLSSYESDDAALTASRELACAAGACDIL